MHIFKFKKRKFDDYKNIICLGNKTKLGFLLIKTLKQIVIKENLNICVKDYYDSQEFLNKNNLSIQRNIFQEKFIVIFCASGGVRTENHNPDKVKISMQNDLNLLRELVKYSKGIHIVYISSVLGLISSTRNNNYSFSKKKAELEFNKIFLDYENILKLSIIYPGRLRNNWLSFFISGSITYGRLVKIILEIIFKKVNLNYFLIGLDAFIFLLIKRPRILKDLSLKIM